MDDQTWRRIERVFHQVIEGDPSQWSALLDAACDDDHELRSEVEALLAHHTRTGQLFDTPRRVAEDLLDSGGHSPDDEAGRTVGAYRLEREIGRGGMGRVFLAVRADLPKRVALKLVREPLGSPDRLDRFRTEQRVLAGLDHPHIAQLVDAGVTEDGSAWFAMEFVDGESVTAFCDRGRYTIDQRLRLFLDLCSAVRYAHAHLVVHRDIKPSNVLVTRDGRPKLLDFGIAKLIATDGEGDPTRTGLRAFTPTYAAPEQLTGDRVSTATDVYQLGALLYELLVGRPPLDVAGKSPGEAERVVLDEVPVAPSVAVVRASEPVAPDLGKARLTPADLADRRSTTPDRLRRRVAGDLENIVLKALQKEPGRRYASVEAFAQDVERFLDGRPVLARPAGAAYRARKFLLRHQSAAALALVLVVYAATVTVGAIGMGRERDRAEREAATATRVSDFLVEVFTRADPTDTVPGQATALDLVDRGVRQVDEELADQPEIRAAMQEVLGRVYHEFGRDDEAEPLLRASAATRREVFGRGSLELASAQHYLAQVLWATGDLEGADTLSRQALDVRRALLDDGDAAVWETLNDLGTIRQFQGRLEEAERLLADVVGMVQRSHPDGHPSLGGYLSNLANIRYARGDYVGAQAMMQEALESDRRFLPADHPFIALRLDNLAFMTLRAEDYDEALETAEEALAMYWRAYEVPHPDMPYAMGTIAEASLSLGDTLRADSMHFAALALRETLFGPGHPDLYESYRNVGRHLLGTGRAAAAESYFEEALGIARETRSTEHEWYGSALWHLGRVREELNDLERAESLMREALAIHTSALGEDHPTVAEERGYLERLSGGIAEAAQEESVPSRH